jgi:hypothetical protein
VFHDPVVNLPKCEQPVILEVMGPNQARATAREFVGRRSGWPRDRLALQVFIAAKSKHLNTGDSKVLCLDRGTCETFRTLILPSFQFTIWIPVARPCGLSVTPT